VKEIARNILHANAKEIAYLRARDQDRNPVHEPHDHRSREILHQSTQPRHSHQYQPHTRQHGARKQPIDAVPRNDSQHHNHECARGPSDLRLGAAQRRNQEAGDDRAVNSCLRRHTRSNGKRHHQRHRRQPHGDSRNQIGNEFVEGVFPKKYDGLGQPRVWHDTHNLG
jgi:hypothetical protein